MAGCDLSRRLNLPIPFRVVVPTDSRDSTAWSEALGSAAAIQQNAPPSERDVILLTHTKQQLSSLAAHIGANNAKALLVNRDVPFSGGRLRHASLQTLRGSAAGAIIIACYADSAMMDKVDGLKGLVGIVVVPDLPDGVDRWILRWNPHVLGQPAAAPARLIEDSVVEKALTSLSGLVNLGNSILNPRDAEYADEYLRILRAKGHVLESDKIKSWAIRNGWLPDAAAELAKLAQKIGQLKATPSLKGFYNPGVKYTSWTV